MMRRPFNIILRIAVSLLLLIFLFKQIDIAAVWNIVLSSDKFFLVTGFLILGLNYVFCLWRWQMLLRALHIHLSLKRVIISYSGGIFFNLFLPSTIGGDLARSIDLSQHTQKPTEVVTTVFLDRLSGYIGLVILVVLSLFLGGKLVLSKSVILSVVILTAILIAALMVLFNKDLYSLVNRLLSRPNAGKLRAALRSLHHQIHIFKHHKSIIINSILLSLVIQAVTPVTFYFTGRAIGLDTGIFYYLVFLPIITAIAMLPISIGGLGLRETSVVFFFSQVGIAKGAGLVMSLLSFSFSILYGILGGLIYVLTVRHRRIQHH